MPKIDVKCLTVGDFQVNCYLVVNAETRECLIVDPGAEGERIIRAAQEYKPAAVLLTHAHWDHIGAVDAVCGHFGIPLYVHEADAPKLTDSTKNVARQFGCDVTVATRPHLLHGGETLFLADMEIRVLHTPGHSAGSFCCSRTMRASSAAFSGVTSKNDSRYRSASSMERPSSMA